VAAVSMDKWMGASRKTVWRCEGHGSIPKLPGRDCNTYFSIARDMGQFDPQVMSRITLLIIRSQVILESIRLSDLQCLPIETLMICLRSYNLFWDSSFFFNFFRKNQTSSDHIHKQCH
jgi:hypothetical protein